MAVTTFPLRFWSLDFQLPGTTPATAANYPVMFWTAPVACIVTGAKLRFSVAGSGGACTVMLTKVPSGTAVGAGTACLSAGISLTGTADTNAAGTLHATPANYTLAAGDSLAWAITGTPTSLANFSATTEVAAV